MKRIGAALVLAVALTTGVQAGPFGISELRGGIYDHSWDERGPDGSLMDLTHIEDANFEVLFEPLPLRSYVPGLVRPNLGATINFGGLESMVYGGISWKLPVFSTPLFVEAGFGGSLNDGVASGAVYPARDLGCNALFHEQISLGWDVSDSVDVMFTAEHASSANLCSPNRGLSNAGIRIGWKF